MTKPTVHIISLGGTILSTASHFADPFYSKPSLGISHILNQLPNIDHLANIYYSSLYNISSHEITHDQLLFLARKINALALNPEVDGIVITLGTNALEEIAYFIHLVAPTEKPVVFTGAMKPANALGYDGARNLYNAIVLASSAEARSKGVLITFNDCITSAKDSAKLNPSLINDFAGNHFALLGYIHGQQVCFYRFPAQKRAQAHEFHIDQIKNFPLIPILYGHLGMDDILVDAAIKSGARGIISAGMGSGYQTGKTTLALAKASDQGIFIIRCSRTGLGMVHYDIHTDDTHGFIPGGTLTPQKARILLSVALNKTNSKEVIQRIFLES